MLTQFNASLSIIPDNEYFGIIETYIGKVPTPFHKPQLHHALATFFANDEVIRNVMIRIDELDALLISALALCESLSEENLCRMFSETHPYTKVMERVINLEERLIFLPDPLMKKQIFINPLLLKVLKREVISIDLLFKGSGEYRYKITHHLPYYLQALTSFSIHLSKEKKRKEKEVLLQTLFYNAHQNDEDQQRWQKAIIDYLTLLVERHNVHSLLSLSPTQIMYRLILEISKVEALPLVALQEHEDLYRFLQFLEQKLEELEISSLDGCKRLVYIASFMYNIQISDIDRVCSLLHFLGMIPLDNKNNVIETSSGIIDTDLSITFHPSLSHYTSNNIHYYAQITSFDTAIMYVITKTSVCRAFDYNFSVEDIIEDISSWSAHLSPLLKQQLEYMYHEYEQIKIYDGMSVVVSDRLEAIIDNYQPLKPFIVKKIAKKVYLFTRENEKKWRNELVKIGVVTLPSTISSVAKDEEEEIELFEIDIDDNTNFLSDEIFSSQVTHTMHPKEYVQMRESLKSVVTSRFPIGTIRDELLAKIEQKIIMLPSQIKAPTKKNAHIKASGFDFNKKLLVVKTAMEHKSLLLDISCLNEDGELDSMIGHPVAYTANDNNGSVIIKTIPDNKEVVIPIQKIFLIKTIKQSVFFKI